MYKVNKCGIICINERLVKAKWPPILYKLRSIHTMYKKSHKHDMEGPSRYVKLQKESAERCMFAYTHAYTVFINMRSAAYKTLL